MRNIGKFYGHVEALRGVDLTLGKHEVLGLVGDNAAGKSTLMKILAAVIPPTTGDVLIEGQDLHIRSPLEARLAGIETAHQHYALCGNLDVVANVCLGREARRPGLLGRLGFLDKQAMDKQTIASLHEFSGTIGATLHRSTEMLSGGQRQAVTVVRVAAFAAKIIILDEPTANLGLRNATRVLDMIRMLRDRGAAVILISHRFNDIFEVTDRIQVLRTGRVAGIRRTKDTTQAEIVSLMFGAGDGSSNARLAAAAE
ncbi:MAG: ATP-binding cassette domain-containing protein [Actinomycetota bacterium]|nr:ATP-binding cassette domain-containing protein [Actinomycetota bacterium]